MSVLGIDLGGTKLAIALFSSDGAILYRDIFPIDKRKGSRVGVLIVHTIKKYLEIAKRDTISISAIGISIPGIYYHQTGNVWAPNIAGWDNYPLLKEVSAISELKRTKVSIDSDRACYILGEIWQGAARGCKNAIFLAVGTGIGAGILVDGRILRGQGDIAGAVGWMGLLGPFREEYRKCGCFEHHASGSGISNITRSLLRKNRDYKGILRQKQIKNISTHDVFEAHKKGDIIAQRVINDAILYWGMAVANLVSTFNPEKIIFGGGIFGPAVEFLTYIEREARKWAQPISMNQVQIAVSALGGDAGLYGAGKLALESITK
jgi:glucokinase